MLAVVASLSRFSMPVRINVMQRVGSVSIAILERTLGSRRVEWMEYPRPRLTAAHWCVNASCTSAASLVTRVVSENAVYLSLPRPMLVNHHSCFGPHFIWFPSTKWCCAVLAPHQHSYYDWCCESPWRLPKFTRAPWAERFAAHTWRIWSLVGQLASHLVWARRGPVWSV